MDPTTAPAAQPSNDAPADTVPDYSSPNDLSFEMTAEEEEAFVDAQLGIKPEAKDEAVDDSTPPAVDKDSTGEKDTDSRDKPGNTGDSSDEDTSVGDASKPVSAPASEEKPAESTTELTAPQTDDLWIEVQDSEGKDVKLTYDPTNPSTFLPDDFTFKNDKQLMDIMEAKAEMANLHKERVADYDKQVAEKQSTENVAKTEADQTASWDAEIQDLIAGGLLEAPKVSDPKDAKFMEDPTVAKVDAVFKFMAEENKTRTAESKPLLRSFGTAFNLLNAKETAAAAEDKTKKDNDMAKARGGLVGGTSGAPSSDAPIYKAGSAKSAWEAAREPESA